MDKLLTEQELVDKIHDITQVMFVTLSEWQAGVTINWESAKIKGRAELMDLLQSQKQAHAEAAVLEASEAEIRKLMAEASYKVDVYSINSYYFSRRLQSLKQERESL